MFAKDKQKHFIAGLAISIIAGPFLYLIITALWCKFTVVSMGLFSFILAALVGALKELVWDWLMKKGTPEWLDFWATALGGCVGFFILLLVR